MREKMRKWNYKRSKRIMDVGGGASRTPLWSLWRCSVPLITIYSYLILFHHISIIFLSFPIILYYYVHKKQVTDQRTDGQADGLTDGWMDGPTDWCINTPSYKDARTHLKKQRSIESWLHFLGKKKIKIFTHKWCLDLAIKDRQR